MNGVRLRHLELGFTLGAAQNLAFLDFFFIDIDFCGTFRATDHSASLRTLVCKVAVRGPSPPPAAYYIPRHGNSTSDRKSTRLNSSHGYTSHAVLCL